MKSKRTFTSPESPLSWSVAFLQSYQLWAVLVFGSGMVLGVVVETVVKIRHLKQFNGLADPYTPFSRWAPLVWPESGAWSQSGELALWAGLVGVLYLLTWLVYVRLFSTLLPVSLSVAARADALASLPAVLSGLYLVSDAVSPRKALCAAFILVIVSKAGMLLWTLWYKDPLARISLAKRKWALFLSAFIIYTLLNLGVNVRGGLVGPEADEPHYLLIAHSLWQDGDVDLANNFQNRDYWRFFPREFPNHGPTLKSGAKYSYHGIGLPVVILPAYVLGNYRGVLVFLSGLTAFLSLQLYLFILEAIGSHRTALSTWLLMAFSAPILIYSSQVFPEICAGLVVLVFVRKLRKIDKNQIEKALLVGLLVGILPWFYVRYLPLEVILVFLFGLQTWRLRWMRLWGVFLISVVGLLLGLSFFHLRTFGSPSPMAGFVATFPTSYFRPKNPLIGLLGTLFDRQFGLIAHSPIYLLVLLGVPVAIKTHPRESVLTLLPFGTTWISVACFAYWHGAFAPPPRLLVVVVPMLSLMVGIYLHSYYGRLRHYLVIGLAGFSYGIAVLLELFPQARYNMPDGNSVLFGLLKNTVSLDLGWLLPSFVVINKGTYLATVLLLGGIIVLLLFHRNGTGVVKRPIDLPNPLIGK